LTLLRENSKNNNNFIHFIQLIGISFFLKKFYEKCFGEGLLRNVLSDEKKMEVKWKKNQISCDIKFDWIIYLSGMIKKVSFKGCNTIVVLALLYLLQGDIKFQQFFYLYLSFVLYYFFRESIASILLSVIKPTLYDLNKSYIHISLIKKKFLIDLCDIFFQFFVSIIVHLYFIDIINYLNLKTIICDFRSFYKFGSINLLEMIRPSFEYKFLSDEFYLYIYNISSNQETINLYFRCLLMGFCSHMFT
jgi:hypothetical protein